MSMSFDSGVTSYVKAQATVEVYFPVDKNGVAYCSCSQCPFYHYQSRRCALTNAVCEMNPDKYVSSHCPLEREDA